MKAEKMKRSTNGASRQEKANGATEERVTQYLPLVRFVAEKIHRRLPPGVDLESLIHSGVVGLLEALQRFDPNRGVEFEIYARYRIRGEVMQCLRSLDWVSRSVRSWGRKIEAARGKLAGQHVREPTAEEIAAELAIPLDTYYHLDQQVNDAAPLSFVEGKDLVEKLAAAVEVLPERERVVVTLYYHEELTLREIGEILDLSEGRICQIFAPAVGRLRDALGGSVKPRAPSAGKRAADARKAPRAAEAVRGEGGAGV